MIWIWIILFSDWTTYRKVKTFVDRKFRLCHPFYLAILSQRRKSPIFKDWTSFGHFSSNSRKRTTKTGTFESYFRVQTEIDIGRIRVCSCRRGRRNGRGRSEVSFFTTISDFAAAAYGNNEKSNWFVIVNELARFIDTDWFLFSSFLVVSLIRIYLTQLVASLINTRLSQAKSWQRKNRLKNTERQRPKTRRLSLQVFRYKFTPSFHDWVPD